MKVKVYYNYRYEKNAELKPMEKEIYLHYLDLRIRLQFELAWLA